MNKAELLSILENDMEYSAFQDDFESHDFQLGGCTSYLERSTPRDLCFYDLKEGDKAQNRLKKRLSASKVALLILNRHSEELRDVLEKTPHLVIKKNHWISAQKKICDHFYPLELESKKMIGVTGTNGKTTTVYLALQILDQIGERGFSIGSLGVRNSSQKLEDIQDMTTPPYPELRRLLFHYFKNYNVCVMEVSSHGLEQERVYGLLYDAAGWTNFDRDHLDYHKTLEKYFEAKLKFPKHHLKPNKRLLVSRGEKELIERLNEIPIQTIKTRDESKMLYPKEHFFSASFNRKNMMMALGLIEETYGKTIPIQWEEMAGPPGRFEILKKGHKMGIIDSAHTPDAFKSILKAIRESFPERKIITVFGCGGDRDRGKRALMGKMAERYSDITIVTSDNPRSEKPEQIIDEIISQMKGPYHRKTDRSQAIALGVSLLKDQNLLAILGKGAENYQIIGSKRKVFSDRDEFCKYIS
ncbi:MAG: UDP-N-acetylmuramoyl-L-alanyl-D-glutamate--2,6-diaminopimelate ligase [Bacteriovoracales bacterium]|nr:UDP-N-acetylmuramoyl-L-alanyl-D-glutamate--2,6-diaminopimelate ligase [Bacteriovoracales bacterium]